MCGACVCVVHVCVWCMCVCDACVCVMHVCVWCMCVCGVCMCGVYMCVVCECVRGVCMCVVQEMNKCRCNETLKHCKNACVCMYVHVFVGFCILYVCPLYRSIYGARGGGGQLQQFWGRYNGMYNTYCCKRGRGGRGQLERGQQTFSF